MTRGPARRAGEVVELEVERAVAGGRMLARLDGQVVLVSGTLPGERVRARISRAARGVVFAETLDVLAASPDRRDAGDDPACGGLLFRHVAYDRQLSLKGDIVADALRRIARLPDVTAPAVAGSAEPGYRLRARLHVRGGRVGFFREGTHEICDPAITGQMRSDALAAVAAVTGVFARDLDRVETIAVAENVEATERVVHLSCRPGTQLEAGLLDARPQAALTGVTWDDGGPSRILRGRGDVTDTAGALFGADPPIAADTAWTRRATSFFQGHRHLTGPLVRHVLEQAAGERVVDLYAGVGLFAVALAARGASVVAVEGDRSSGGDLGRNAGPYADRLLVVRSPVEQAVARVPASTPDAVVLDPPRTGASAEAVGGLLRWKAPRVVYVSCDPPTFARDAARFAAAGYRLRSLAGFDLFPDTPHVEVVGTFVTDDAGSRPRG